jgi:hypothetical protein
MYMHSPKKFFSVTSGPAEQDNHFAIIPEVTTRLIDMWKKDVLRPRFKEIACNKTILLGCLENAVRCVADLEEFDFAGLSPNNEERFEESAIDRNGPQKS